MLDFFPDCYLIWFGIFLLGLVFTHQQCLDGFPYFNHTLCTPLVRKDFLSYSFENGQNTKHLPLDRGNHQSPILSAWGGKHRISDRTTWGYIQELNEKAGAGESGFVISRGWSDPWFPWEDTVDLIELFPDLAGHNTRLLGISYKEGDLARGLYPLEGLGGALVVRPFKSLSVSSAVKTAHDLRS